MLDRKAYIFKVRESTVVDAAGISVQVRAAGISAKLADLIDNTASIVQHDPGFAKVYMTEKRNLLPVLVQGNSDLYEKACRIVELYFLSI